MRHEFIDKYSNLNSPLHRLGPMAKLIFALGILLLVIFMPIKYFFVLTPFILFLLFLSRVPFFYFLKRSFVIAPFIVLVALSGKWDVMLRGFMSVLTVILLSSVTKFSDLLKALGRLGCPKLIVMMMAFLYRYIYVFVDELMRMKQAKDSRTLKRNRWEDMRILSNLVGVLFIRTYERAERIYMSMCSRGFSGTVK